MKRNGQKPKLRRLPGRRPGPRTKADVEIIYRPYGSDGLVVEEADCEREILSVPLDKAGKVGVVDMLVDFTIDAEIVVRPVRRSLEDVDGTIEDAARIVNEKPRRSRRRKTS